MLQDVDALVFDIQDIGARFYTYITTMGYCMEEASKAKIPFYVLDRPNPIGGVQVEGPMLDPDKTSFTGYHAFARASRNDRWRDRPVFQFRKEDRCAVARGCNEGLVPILLLLGYWTTLGQSVAEHANNDGGYPVPWCVPAGIGECIGRTWHGYAVRDSRGAVGRSAAFCF